MHVCPTETILGSFHAARPACGRQELSSEFLWGQLLQGHGSDAPPRAEVLRDRGIPELGCRAIVTALFVALFLVGIPHLAFGVLGVALAGYSARERDGQARLRRINKSVKQQPSLKTNRLVLRPLMIKDAISLRELANSPKIADTCVWLLPGHGANDPAAGGVGAALPGVTGRLARVALASPSLVAGLGSQFPPPRSLITDY
jgi:hypothetical protein